MHRDYRDNNIVEEKSPSSSLQHVPGICSYPEFLGTSPVIRERYI